MNRFGCATCPPAQQAPMYPQGYMRAPEFRGVGALDYEDPRVRFGLMALSLGSAAASTYHGYKRNRGSVPWALAWGFLGGMFPIVTPAIAVAQGFGKPAR